MQFETWFSPVDPGPEYRPTEGSGRVTFRQTSAADTGGGGTHVSFSVGRSSQRQSAGRKIIAAIMFTTNMKVSMSPMSAWNLRSDQIHVATPAASVSAV